MSIGIIRAARWSAARADADPVQPRLDVAALPHSAPGSLSIPLRRIVSALRIFRPVQGEAIPHQPLT